MENYTSSLRIGAYVRISYVLAYTECPAIREMLILIWDNCG